MESVVARPLELVEHVVCQGMQQEQEQEQASGGGGNSVHARVVEAFRARLRAQGPAALASIPLLNPATWAADRASGKLGPNTLVRFRGMVQDMLDPQFFVGVQRHARTGALRCALYSDGPAGVGIGGGEAAGAGAWEAYQTMERRPLILTPIPGEAPWVMEGLRVEGTQPAPKQQQGGAAGASGGGNKRGLGDGGEGAMEVVGEEEQQQQQRGGKAPRIAAADDAAADAMAVDGGCSVAVSAASVLAAGGGGLRCLSYFYGEDEEEAGAAQQQPQPSQSQAAPRLNEAVDVLAVLCYTPAGVPAMGPPEGEQVDEEEAAMEQLLLGLEPRLHILLWAPAPALVPTPAAFHDPAPFLLPTPTTNADNVTANDPPVPAVRAALLAHLTAALDGDALAAEYLLLALISRVRLRTPTGDVVGPLPLNLSRATPETAARVASLVGRLCPRSRVLTVDLPTLDDPKAFIPRKDPARLNVLETTPLQVCPGTALVLDETRLDSGRLGAEGVANLRCLKGLIERQALPCHFGFYALDFHADSPVVVISKSRSILTSGGGSLLCQVPHSPPSDPQPPTTTIDNAAADEAMEGAIRRYLAAAAAREVEIDAGVAARAEREFVGLRATEEGKKSLTPEALGRWLTLCRLLCASGGGGGGEDGGKVVGEGEWERMRALEAERVGRLRALGLDPPAQ